MKMFQSIRLYFEIHRWIRRLLFGVIGGALGYTYYHFIGCASGACPITGNPYISTLYGAAIGMIILPSKKKSEEL
jgi:hypothetical protein